MKAQNIISWVLRIAAAVILLQSLFFKFSAAPESVELFSALGLEPVGRIGVGVIELITGILILIPRTAWLGAILAAGTMAGAIFAHLTTLGIEVQEDGGTLFFMAVAVLIASLVVLFLHKEDALKLLGRA